MTIRFLVGIVGSQLGGDARRAIVAISLKGQIGPQGRPPPDTSGHRDETQTKKFLGFLVAKETGSEYQGAKLRAEGVRSAVKLFLRSLLQAKKCLHVIPMYFSY